jgi:DNA recombination protein RmuC
MPFEHLLQTYGWITAGCLGGFLLGWLMARTVSVRRISEEKTANAILKESLRNKSEFIEILERDLKAADAEIDKQNNRFLELSKTVASAESRLAQMDAVKAQLGEAGDENQRLTDRMAGQQQRLTELETLVESERKIAREKAAMLEEMTVRMTDAFKALSARALSENNQSFIDLAGQTFSQYVAAAKHEFETKEKAVKEFIRPVAEALDQYDRQVRSMEKAREKAYGELSQQMVALSRTQDELQRETGKLVNALRMPHVRGRWGELTLRRVVELAGMQNRCDFFEQQTGQKFGQAPDDATRPDMIIQLPGKRQIVVDAKVPIMAYLDSLETEDPDRTEEMLARHAAHVRTHVKQLAAKEYWRRFQPTPEFVVLFMPGENFFSAALGKAPGLIEEAADRGVILATPTTLISLLKAVAYGWKQENATENARIVSELGNELYQRIAKIVGHFNSLGSDLDRCVNSYNRAVGSFERRVLPTARKFEDLDVIIKGKHNIPNLSPVDNKPRSMQTEESDP